MHLDKSIEQHKYTGRKIFSGKYLTGIIGEIEPERRSSTIIDDLSFTKSINICSEIDGLLNRFIKSVDKYHYKIELADSIDYAKDTLNNRYDHTYDIDLQNKENQHKALIKCVSKTSYADFDVYLSNMYYGSISFIIAVNNVPFFVMNGGTIAAYFMPRSTAGVHSCSIQSAELCVYDNKLIIVHSSIKYNELDYIYKKSGSKLMVCINPNQNNLCLIDPCGNEFKFPLIFGLDHERTRLIDKITKDVQSL